MTRAPGNVYTTGFTASTNFPTANALQPGKAGSLDVFVTKLNASGNGLIYSTYLGGNQFEQGSSIAVDSVGNAYVIGATESANFPTANALQSAKAGGVDAFLTKLNSSGSLLVYSTFLGGSGTDRGFGVAVDSFGDSYITGSTDSSNFPTANAFQPSIGGNLDAFVSRLNSTGSAFVYSTYLGGSNVDAPGRAIGVDGIGNAYVTGLTDSANFPTANALQSTITGSSDVFVTKLSSSGLSLIYSTFLGGSGFDQASSIAVDSAGNAWITGFGTSTNFPTVNPLQPGSGGLNDGFVVKIGEPTNQVPLAYCHNVVVSTGSECNVAALIDDGSFDPDGDLITLNQSPAGPYPVGETSVTLTVTDNHGAFSTCSATVTVTDDTAPVITPPPAVEVFTGATASTCGTMVSDASLGTGTVSDNCSVTFSRLGVPENNFFPIGTTIITYTATDSNGNTATTTQAVTVIDNTKPTITAPPAITVLTGSAAGSCSAIVTNLMLGSPLASDICPGVQVGRSGVPVGNVFPVGTTTVTYSAIDAAGNTSLATQLVTVIDNTPPAITCPVNVNVVADPGTCSAVVSYEVSANDNCGVSSLTTSIAPGSAFPIGTTTVSATAADATGNSSSCNFTVTVTNPNPVVTITSPASENVFPVNTPINFSGTYTDAGGGTHSSQWMFDLTTQVGTVTEPNGSTPGTISTTHTFTAAGVYMVSLVVNDSCGGIGISNTANGLTAMVVIYDPNGGFVTGGGFIDSPIGAYRANPMLAGKAVFGFQSKYQPGASVPTGSTEFRFQVADFKFSSTNYDWLVISGARAQYKGTGTVDGSGNFGFLLTAIDGQITGGGGVDKFRIKIWDKNNSDIIVYDNQSGAPDSSNPTTALGGGSILIQKQ